MNYDVIFSSRRTVALSIKNEKLIVRAPYGMSKIKIDGLVKKHEKWISKHVEIQAERNKRIPNLTTEEIVELKKRAKIYLSGRTQYFADIMGLKYGRITITGAKTRFGSCSAKGNICYSYRLLLYPKAAIDYVVVHELSHLVHMNHSSDFYRLVSSILPDYKERKKLLK